MPPTIIDTHCHLYTEDFDADIATVIRRAQDVGVQQFYLPNIDSASIDSMLKLETDFPGVCIPMMGLHPCSVKEDYKNELAVVESWLQKRTFAAVGEIGLDFHWDKTFTDQQYEAFHQQIEWAKAYNLPIVIHTREAMQQCIDVVKQHKDEKLKGIFHCFGGSINEAKQIIDLGFYLGIGGVLTYKKARLKETLKEISIKHLVLETDAPYLTPVPFRGKRNESAYLQYIIEALAEAKNIPIEEVASVTTANANFVFQKQQHVA
ncbi:hydrolase TatD [Terrimonas sp.]|uniref:TatD family hydrolase n=1 Tax=Terrimonas sp. TaxID=1914338 RepID=UPI000D50FC38|nr:TatD family hydrolase [Terrimonas sp.]PVD51039.1 hydrolase TatD [Terrimonas sp.]